MMTMLTALEVTPVVLYGKFSNARVCEYLKYLFSLISTSLGKFLSEQLDEYKKQVATHDQAFAEIVKEPSTAYDRIGKLKKDMLTTEARFNRKWLRFVKIYRKYLESNIELGLPVESCPASMIYQDFPSLLAKTQAETLPVSVLCDHILERYDFKTDKRIHSVLCEIEKENTLRRNESSVRNSDQKLSNVNNDVSSGTSHVTESQTASDRKEKVEQDAMTLDIQPGQDTLNKIAVLFLAQHCNDDRLAAFKDAIKPVQCIPTAVTGLNEKRDRACKRKAFESTEVPGLDSKQARTNLHNNVTPTYEQPTDRPGMVQRFDANLPNTSGPSPVKYFQAKQQCMSNSPDGVRHKLVNEWHQPWMPPMPFAANVPRFGQWKPNEVPQSHQWLDNCMAAPRNGHRLAPWISTGPCNGPMLPGNQAVGNHVISDRCQLGLIATHTDFQRPCPRGSPPGFNAYRGPAPVPLQQYLASVQRQEPLAPPVGCLTSANGQSCQSGSIC